jgi:hypothetical protein
MPSFVVELQRVLDVQQLVHNWVRPHWGLGKNTTTAMAMGYCEHPISMHKLLTSCVIASPIERPVPVNIAS